MRVYATELICSTRVLGFHTFKLALCIYNKLRSHAEILSWWAFDVTFPGSNPLRSNRSDLNVSNGGSWNPKFTLKVNSFWIKIKSQNFASQVLSRHTFKISRKKGSDFFDHRGTLIGSAIKSWITYPVINFNRNFVGVKLASVVRVKRYCDFLRLACNQLYTHKLSVNVYT